MALALGMLLPLAACAGAPPSNTTEGPPRRRYIWDRIERTMGMGEGYRDGFMPMFEAAYGLSDKKFDYFQYEKK